MDLISSYQAIWIGQTAFETVAESFQAKIFGSTSRGIFLLGPAGQVLFLSYEPHPGPLSINLAIPPLSGRLEASPNQTAQVSLSWIRLLSGEQILLNGAAVWRPPALPATRAGHSARQDALREVSGLALTQKGDGLAPLLASIYTLPGPPLPAWQQPFEQAWTAIEETPNSGLLSISQQFEAVLGLGKGLTPSGDDFICGFLLALNRLAPSEQPDEVLPFGSGLVQAARRRTTALSAAMIESASQGRADRRLLLAWDGLLCGTLTPTQIFQNLAEYGSSSGIDVLAGFIAAQGLIKD